MVVTVTPPVTTSVAAAMEGFSGGPNVTAPPAKPPATTEFCPLPWRPPPGS